MNMLFVYPMISGWQEWLIIIVVALFLFGGSALIPRLMKNVGKGIKSVKEGMKEVEKELYSEPATEKKAEEDKSEEK